jgi:hypothetical protein
MSDQQPYDRLKQLQRDALLHLLRGDRPEHIADRLDITTRTLRRWRNQPDFKAAFAAAREDFFTACQSEINIARARAFVSLNQIARQCSESNAQVRAATTILEFIERPEMSALATLNQPQANTLNNLVPFSPDNSGHSRTQSDKPTPLGSTSDTPRQQ